VRWIQRASPKRSEVCNIGQRRALARLYRRSNRSLMDQALGRPAEGLGPISRLTEARRFSRSGSTDLSAPSPAGRGRGARRRTRLSEASLVRDAWRNESEIPCGPSPLIIRTRSTRQAGRASLSLAHHRSCRLAGWPRGSLGFRASRRPNPIGCHKLMREVPTGFVPCAALSPNPVVSRWSPA
jgi:hypothetical protein